MNPGSCARIDQDESAASPRVGREGQSELNALRRSCEQLRQHCIAMILRGDRLERELVAARREVERLRAKEKK